MQEVNLDTWESFQDQLRLLSKKQAAQKQQCRAQIEGQVLRSHIVCRLLFTPHREVVVGALDCARPASTPSTPARNDQSCVRDARARSAPIAAARPLFTAL